ncbi:hypothetical protein ALNOE001_20220 [Candidatus Methanobinarius endosymbioticus]|uniref:Right handed beta helix domain-containing protein n=1 Tax=Candidatus Methanobinarius endosymbioticus TaxID=2006182 RepID=A0A366M9W9_9EURY|nr:hypothetical protein ALNOE001_20220 [Candidatus Methanobinarius endosymbioticus]
MGNLVIIDSNFTKNDQFQVNGGIISGNGKWIISGSNFINNYADGTGPNGGNINFYGTSLNINNSNFINNSVNGTGGAIYISGNNGTHNIDSCNFVNNSATNGGGAIYNYYTNSTVKYSLFYNNTDNLNRTFINTENGSLIADYKWFGQNDINPDWFTNTTVNKWFVITLSTIKNKIDFGYEALFKYTIKLNDGTTDNVIKLPYFNYIAFGKPYDARVSRTLSHIYSTSGNKTLNLNADKQLLKVNITVLSVSRILKQVTTETISVNNIGIKTSKLRYTFKNFCNIKGSKAFTVKINKKFILTGLKTTKNVLYKYYKKIGILKLNIKNLDGSKTASIKLGVKRTKNVVSGKLKD